MSLKLEHPLKLNKPAGSYWLDRDTAKKTVSMLRPFLLQAMTVSEIGESGFLYIVIMDPAITSSESTFEEAILYEHSIGDPARWDADYKLFAQAKAKISWVTGSDSHTVQEHKPYLLKRGDTILWGSAVIDGIVVGVSGANPWYDEAIASTIASWLKAAAHGRSRAKSKELFLT